MGVSGKPPKGVHNFPSTPPPPPISPEAYREMREEAKEDRLLKAVKENKRDDWSWLMWPLLLLK